MCIWYACVFLYGHTRVYGCRYVNHVCTPTNEIRCLSQLFSTLFIEGGTLFSIGSSLIPANLAIQLAEYAVSHSLELERQVATISPCFSMRSGDQNSSYHDHEDEANDLSTKPSPWP